MQRPLVTRILVADDHALIREGLKHVINAEPDLEVVAEAADGAEAIKRALAGDIHLAILDISMPRMTGLQAARELSHRRPELRLLMLSMYDNEQFLFEALKAGAPGRHPAQARHAGPCRPHSLRDPPRPDPALGGR